jgi:WD40 repeat protein
VLTWSTDKTARLWDVTKPELLQTFKHDSYVVGAQFSRDESRVLTWSYDNTARLWDVTQPEPLQTFKHDGPVRGSRFSRDESRVLTWSSGKTARLWDVAKPDPLQTFKHDSLVNGAQFSRDESRVLTWSGGEVRLWDNTDPLAVLTPSERIRELEVRSGTTLDEAQNLRLLKFDEWQDRVKSPKPAPQPQATNQQPTVETPGSSSKR